MSHYEIPYPGPPQYGGYPVETTIQDSENKVWQFNGEIWTEVQPVLVSSAPGTTPSQVGGSSAGSPVVRKFPFAFDTPGLLTGAAVYTPTVGDILLDAWIEIDTAWDGTSPRGDIGTFVDGPGSTGWFSDCVGSYLDMAASDTDINVDDGLLSNSSMGGSLAIATMMDSVSQGLMATSLNTRLVFVQGSAFNIGGPFPPGHRAVVPARFTAANPIKVVVSQDGTTTGADPGSTQGAAVLYLVTATPVTS